MSRRVRTQTGKTNRPQVESRAEPTRASRSRLVNAAEQNLQQRDGSSPTRARVRTGTGAAKSGAAARRHAPPPASSAGQPRGGARGMELPSIHNEVEAVEFVDKSLLQAKRFKDMATKRRIFAQMSEYMRGRGKGTLQELYTQISTHGGTGIGHSSHGKEKRGITRQDFKDFLRHTSLGPCISDADMNVAFDLADRDRSGIIDHDEFVDVFAPEQLQEQHVVHHDLDVTNAERLQVKHELDSLRLKVLNKLAAAGKRDGEAGGVGRALWKAYKVMDANGDGSLSYAEFKNAIGPGGFNINLSHSEQHQLAVACDLNFDGTISPEEFAFTLLESHYPDLKHYFQDEREELMHKLKRSVENHAKEYEKHREFLAEQSKQFNQHGSAKDRAVAAAAAAAARKARTAGSRASTSPASTNGGGGSGRRGGSGRFAGMSPEKLREMYFMEKIRVNDGAKVQHRGFQYGANHQSSFDIAPRSARSGAVADPFATTNDLHFRAPAAAAVGQSDKMPPPSKRRTTNKYSSVSQNAFTKRALDWEDPANRQRHAAPTTVVGIPPDRLAARLRRQGAYDEQHTKSRTTLENQKFRRDQGRLNALRFQRQKYLEKVQEKEQYSAVRQHNPGKRISKSETAVKNRGRSMDANGPLW